VRRRGDRHANFTPVAAGTHELNTRSPDLALLAFVLALAPAPLRALDLHDCVIEPSMSVDLSSSEVGVLEEVHVEIAGRVSRSQVIASLQTDVEQASLRFAEARAKVNAEIEVQREQQRFLARKRERLDALDVSQSISKEALDEVRTEETLARLRISQLREERELARLQSDRDRRELARRQVRSPIDGVVAQRYKDPGEYIDGDTIVQIVRLDPLRVRIVAPLSLHGQVAVGMRAMITPELDATIPREATVTHIDPLADVATATFGIRLELPNPGGVLLAGLRCSASVDPSRKLASKPAESTGAGVSADADAANGAMVQPEPPTNVTPQAASSDPADPTAAMAAADSTQGVNGHLAEASTQGQPCALPAVLTRTVPRPSVPRKQSRQCLAIGSTAEIDLASVLRSLDGMGIEHVLRTAHPSDVPRFIVMSPPPARALTRTIRAMRSEGALRDVARLHRGAWKGRYSFGVYSRLDSALERTRQLEQLGLTSEVRARDGDKGPIWIDLPGLSQGDELPQGLRRLIGTSGGLELEPVAGER
jgi:RND family efflux transporter MFP subunit